VAKLKPSAVQLGSFVSAPAVEPSMPSNPAPDASVRTCPEPSPNSYNACKPAVTKSDAPAAFV